jgi:hypothetical protein
MLEKDKYDGLLEELERVAKEYGMKTAIDFDYDTEYDSEFSINEQIDDYVSLINEMAFDEDQSWVFKKIIRDDNTFRVEIHEDIKR